MNEEIMYLFKLNNKIFRSSQIYLDKKLKDYELSSGSYPYLLILDKNEGISQNKISEELGCDKAMSARTITKLIKLGYLDRRQDETDSRAYKLYLTENAKVIIPKVLEEVHKLIHLVTDGSSEQEKKDTINFLNNVVNNIKELNS